MADGNLEKAVEIIQLGKQCGIKNSIELEVALFKALADAERQIVFYSESHQDWHHFAPVIAELHGRGVQVCYLASDEGEEA